jgi:hypothetical protein
MDEKTLDRLMSSGALCVADIKCLDCDSKACVWRLALRNSVRPPPDCPRKPQGILYSLKLARDKAAQTVKKPFS